MPRFQPVCGKDGCSREVWSSGDRCRLHSAGASYSPDPSRTGRGATKNLAAEKCDNCGGPIGSCAICERARIERIIETYRTEHRHAEDRMKDRDSRALLRQRIHACDHLLADIRGGDEGGQTVVEFVVVLLTTALIGLAALAIGRWI
jgi:hypothetical protein